METWLGHWNLHRDPFHGSRPDFVATPGHAEAVARLVHTIETVGRSARLIAGAGSGKSRVLTRALEATRSPSRRIARIAAPVDGADLFGKLASELGNRISPDSSRSTAWRALTEAARLCRWQGLHVILAIDDCHGLATDADRIDLDRLEGLDPDPSARLTVLCLGRPGKTEELCDGLPTTVGDWGLSIRLDPLTRSETALYVEAKLKFAGRVEPAFTPRAITRLHSASAGIPRGIDRIAGLALMASACRGLEIVTPDLVEEAAGECPAIARTSTEF